MILKRLLISVTTLVFLFSCTQRSEGLKTTDVPRLMDRFLGMHVVYHQFNDTISERMLHNYIHSFDAGKYYFYQSDVDSFMKHSERLDDYVNQGNYDLMYNIHQVFKKRFEESMELFDELLERNYDFNKDETMISDRSVVKYASSKQEMRERWRKNIKLQLLNYLAADKDIKEAKKKLRKKYRLMEKRINEIDEEKLITRYLNSFSMALDPHSNYLSQKQHEDFKIHMELKLEGIGARLRSEDGFVIVESLIPGGAADKLPKGNRIKPGDKIVAVAQGNSEPVDVIDMDLRDVVQKIRGPKGTEVRLTVLREDPESGKTERLVIPIVREEIRLQDSDAESETYLLKNRGKSVNIGYIKLPSFYQDKERNVSSAGDVRRQLNLLMEKNCEVIVLDLRGNPGGLLNEAVDIAGFFIDEGPVVQIKAAQNRPMVMRDNDSGILYKGPLVVLIDKFSASASEILAGAIRDYRRGLIIGPSSTFGKGTVQSYNPLPNEKGAVKITTHIFYQPGGTSNQLNGIRPHIIVPDISSVWDIGESNSRYPLKWEPIPRADFQSYRFVSDRYVNILKELSGKRVSQDQDFQKLQEKIRRLKEQQKKKTISLKEESSMEQEQKKELEKTFNNRNGDRVINLEEDIFLREAFNITGDYMKLLGR